MSPVTEPSPAPPPRRQRRPVALFPVIAVLVVAGSVAFVLLRPPGPESQGAGPTAASPPAPAPLSAELSQALQRLERCLGEAEIPLAALDEAKDLARKHPDLRAGGANPFAELHRALAQRREAEVNEALADFDRRRSEFLAGKRYGEALVEARSLEWRCRQQSPAAKLHAANARRAIEEEIDRAFQALEKSIAEASEDDRRDGARSLLAFGRKAFAGTDRVARLEELSKKLDEAFAQRDADVLEARRRALAAAEEERLRQAAQAREAAELEGLESPARARPQSLCALLSEPIGAGKLKEKAFVLSASRQGRPLRVLPGGELEVAAEIGTTRIACDELLPSAQVAMALAALEGEALLAAAEFGFWWDLDADAGRLLHRYLGRADAGQPARQRRIDELLARIRYLDEPPAGGYRYDADHGWEDEAQRRSREIARKAVALVLGLEALTSPSALEAEFAKLLALLADRGLDADAAAALRSGALETLMALKRRALGEVAKGVQRSGLRRLREAKLELNRRRKAALELIRNPAIYLPEDHPDWSKGDVVNGQKRVDEAVDLVRELWSAAGNYAVEVDAGARRRLQLVGFIDGRCFPALEHASSEAEDEELALLRTQFAGAIDLRSFSLGIQEALLYDANRKVDAHNEQLDSPDLAPLEKQHVQVINDYREMLGLRRVFIDIKLCRATQKHSEACNAAGRIWHEGPDGTPQSRAQAEGFGAGVGENVALGYADGADIWWRGWYRASDHHRNGVAAGWNCIGYGYVGNVGTQNFAAVSAPFR